MVVADDLQVRIAQLEQEKATVSLLLQISRDLQMARNEETVFQAVLQPIIASEAFHALLAYLDTNESGTPEWATIVAAWQREGSSTMPAVGRHVPINEIPFHQICVTNPQTTTLISDVHTDNRLNEDARETALCAGNLAAVVMPLTLADRRAALLVCTWTEPHVFTAHEQAIYEALPALLVPALDNRRQVNDLERQIESRTRDLATFHTLVENAIDSIAIFDEDGRLVYANRSRYALFGYNYDRKEMSGLHKRDFWLPEAFAATAQHLEPVLSEGGSFSGQTQQRRKDGSIFDVEYTTFLLSSPDGQPVGTVEFLRDITEHRQVEQAMLQSEEKSRRIIESLPVGIHVYTLNDAGQLTFSGWNSAASRIFGLDSQMFEGKTIDEAFPSLVNTEIPSRYRHVAATGQPWQTEELIYGEDGVARNLEVYAFQSMPGNVVTAFLDITDRKHAQEEREHLQQRIVEAQQKTLAELSTPIIPIVDHIIVMPLVGAIDSIRAQDIMRSLLHGITRYQAKIAILDITGVPIVDTGVAQYLDKTIQAAQLKGVHTLVTGITEAVAEAVVDLGIDWSHIQTLSDLNTGLKVALRMLGLRLHRSSL